MDKTSFKSDKAVEEILSLAGGPESKKATGTCRVKHIFAIRSLSTNFRQLDEIFKKAVCEELGYITAQIRTHALSIAASISPLMEQFHRRCTMRRKSDLVLRRATGGWKNQGKVIFTPTPIPSQVRHRKPSDIKLG